MAEFRTVALAAMDGVKIAGWAVEKHENGVRIAMVSHLYASRAQASREAERLTAIEASKPCPDGTSRTAS